MDGDADSNGGSAVTLLMAPWHAAGRKLGRVRSIRLDAATGAPTDNQLTQSEEVMTVATGRRQVDLRMVRDIPWLRAFDDWFSVVAGARRLPCPGGGALQWCLQRSAWVFLALNIGLIVLFIRNPALSDAPNGL